MRNPRAEVSSLTCSPTNVVQVTTHNHRGLLPLDKRQYIGPSTAISGANVEISKVECIWIQLESQNHTLKSDQEIHQC